MSQLPADCVNEILEYLEHDKVSLRSCLLVNHIWCEIAVRILWRDTWNYNISNFRTLIACLPKESQEILCENGINISTPTSKPPMFNYASFCKVLSTYHVNFKIRQLLSSVLLQNLNDGKNIIVQEIYKLFMSQISSLKELHYYRDDLIFKAIF